jgi:hypothetical protein
MKNYNQIRIWSLNKKFKIILVSILTIMIISCNKDDDDNPADRLPKATETGENTFACLLNGAEWVSNGGLSGDDNVSLVYDKDGSYVWGNHHFSMRSKKSSNWGVLLELFHIQIEPVIKEGQLDIDDLSIFTIEYSIDSNIVDPIVPNEFYELDKNYLTKFELSNIDTINNICSGTFEFQLRNLEDSLDLILITDGRFDVTFRTY